MRAEGVGGKDQEGGRVPAVWKDAVLFRHCEAPDGLQAFMGPQMCVILLTGAVWPRTDRIRVTEVLGKCFHFILDDCTILYYLRS